MLASRKGADPLLLAKVLVARNRVRQRDRWTRQQLDAYQQAALGRLLEHARTRSPFYREFLRGLEKAPLTSLPIVTKAQLSEHWDTIVTTTALTQADVELRLRDMIGPLAEAASQGTLRIAPDKVIAASEVLGSDARRAAERAWGHNVVVDTYAATETAGIASTCQRGSWHLYEDFVIGDTTGPYRMRADSSSNLEPLRGRRRHAGGVEHRAGPNRARAKGRDPWPGQRTSTSPGSTARSA